METEVFGLMSIGDMNISNTTPTTTLMAPRPTRAHFDLFRQLRFYCLAVIIPMGLLFNLLSCAVFLRSRMRKSATVLYFLALACADNFVLTGEFFMWLNAYTTMGNLTGLRFMHEVDGACKFVHFLRYFGRLLSSWLVVAICIERFITVAYPLKSTWSSTPTKAKMVILGLIGACIVLSCPAFFAVGPVMSRSRGILYCKIIQDHKIAYHMWVLCVMIFGELVIPSIIVIIFTTLIIIKLVRASRARRLTKEGQDRGQRSHKDRQPTIALLAVSIAFVTLRTPYVFAYPFYMNKYKIFGRQITGWKRLELQGIYDISFILAVTNYAINFLLYIVTGKTFRGEFKRFLMCKRSQLGPTWSRSYSMTSQTTSLRRFSNSEVLRVKPQNLDDKHTNGSLPKYTIVRQDSHL